MVTWVDSWCGCDIEVKSEVDKLFDELDEGDKLSEMEPCAVSSTASFQLCSQFTIPSRPTASCL